jgi:hypothetical protein
MEEYTLSEAYSSRELSLIEVIKFHKEQHNNTERRNNKRYKEEIFLTLQT